MDDVTRIQDRLWYRRTMKALTKQQVEQELDEKLAKGEITAEEAEAEWQDFMHRGENSFQGVYGW
jgi:polyhydroxyalkanoate synthesis regulator phasin